MCPLWTEQFLLSCCQTCRQYCIHFTLGQLPSMLRNCSCPHQFLQHYSLEPVNQGREDKFLFVLQPLPAVLLGWLRSSPAPSCADSCFPLMPWLPLLQSPTQHQQSSLAWEGKQEMLGFLSRCKVDWKVPVRRYHGPPPLLSWRQRKYSCHWSSQDKWESVFF